MLHHHDVQNMPSSGRGNSWQSYKLEEGPLDTSIIMFDSYNCHSEPQSAALEYHADSCAA